MKPVKILHTGDIHFSPKDPKMSMATDSLRTIVEHVEENDIDLVAISGDFTHAGLVASEGGGYRLFTALISSILRHAPIVAISGTRSHDRPGSVELLENLSEKYQFMFIQPENHAFLDIAGVLWNYPNIEALGKAAPDFRLLIMGCSEPSKDWFLRDKEPMGPDASNEAVKDGIRTLFGGLGAVRASFPELPALMLYHGSVAGASLANGQTLPLGSFEVGREDLALVGANYYALGHIHKAQKLNPYPMCYCGSVYPVDWGEMDQKSFIEVSFVEAEKGFESITNHIPFPHAPRKKIVWDVGEELKLAGVRDYQVWVVARREKDRIPVDCDAVLSMLKAEGALEGSKVTEEIIPEETVRAGNIRGSNGLFDKFGIWAENTGVAHTVAQGQKVVILEKEAEAAGIDQKPVSIRTTKLRLRGAIGIQKGLGLDEIEVDLTQYDEGLIAIDWANGKGKTTIIENMHPYPCLMTRSGKLQDHFMLKDSFRELHFTDEMTGTNYRAVISIDGKSKTGACEYALYMGDVAPVPLTSGGKDDYVEKITELFGSFSLFQRSVFLAQKATTNNPDLADTTQQEKKGIFRELAGLDYLQAVSANAGNKGKGLSPELDNLGGQIEAIETIVQDIPGVKVSIIEAQSNYTDAEVERDDAVDKKALAEKRRDGAREAVEENKRIGVLIRENQQVASSMDIERSTLLSEIEPYKLAIAQKAAAAGRMAGYETTAEKKKELEAQQATVLKERDRISQENVVKRKAFDAETAELRTKATTLVDSMGLLNIEINTKENKKVYLEEKLEQQITCPECDHKFSIGQEEDEAKLNGCQMMIKQLTGQRRREQQECDDLNAELSGLYFPAAELPEFAGAKELEMITGALQVAGEAYVSDKALVEKAALASSKIEANEARCETILLEHAAIEKKIATLEDGLDAAADVQFAEAAFALNDLGGDVERAVRVFAEAEARITSLTERLEGLEAQESSIVGKRAQIETLRVDVADWELLARAFGPNGIQALELDALSPDIMAEANGFLSHAYGSRFRIVIETTRMAGRGSQAKQVEDFRIFVFDSEKGTNQLLDTLSGGEGVWIKKAIYDAFTVISARNTGREFLTAFMDESDGALDSEARDAYFSLIQAAHTAANRSHTVVITHSEEAQRFIGQSIKVN